MKWFGVCSYVFVTLFSAKWLNCQSPCNYLRGAGKGTASKRLMREYWICTSIRVLIKCGLHKDSRATVLTQLPPRTMGGGTAGRRGGQRRHQGKGARWRKKTRGEKSDVECWCAKSLPCVHAKARAERRTKWGETTGGTSVHVWPRSSSLSSGFGLLKTCSHWVIQLPSAP